MDPEQAQRQLRPAHAGQHYVDWISAFSQRCTLRNYLEIGVSEGNLLSKVSCQRATGVDIAFDIKRNIAAGKRHTSLFHMTSDAFFATHRWRARLWGPFDAVMIDGLHLFENVLRDLRNAERFCSRNGVVFIHDALPLNHLMAWRNPEASAQLSAGTPFPGWWTGDVWKIVPILRRYRPDLRVMLVDCWPTGLVVIDRLDPRSTVLARHDEEIHDAFVSPSDERAQLARLYEENAMIPAAAALERLVTSFVPTRRDWARRILSRAGI